MEDTPFQSLNPAIRRQKAQKQNHCANAFHEKAAFQHHFLQSNDTVDIPHTERLSHQQTLLQADTFA